MTVPAVVIQRDKHTVVAGGEKLPRVDIEVQTELPGNPETGRSTLDSIVGEQDSWITLSWDVLMRRETPHKDDQFPLSMPDAIANLGFRAGEDDNGNITYLYMNHLHVQEPARRMGYGQLLWDCYLAVAAYGDLDLRGGIGSTEGAGTVGFLKRQGVPESDISPGRKAGGSGTTKWKTALSNVARRAPIRHTEVNDG